jgi:hypothetical protein
MAQKLQTMKPETKSFLDKMTERAVTKQKQMAAIELSIWDNQKELELVSVFGYTKQQVIERKKELTKIVGKS